MNQALIVLVLFGICAFAQPKFSAPLIGVARDSQKQVRLMHGVAGNFVWREAIGGTATDWAFSSHGGLVKTGTELLVIGANGSVIRRRTVQPGSVVLSPEAAFS